MKKYVVAAAMLISLSVAAQKDELKALRKLSNKETPPTAQEIQEFKALLDKAEPLMANATTEQKADFYYYKGEYAFVEMLNPAKAQQAINSAVENFNKVIEIEKAGKKNHTKEIQEEIFPQLKTGMLQTARQLGKQNMFKEASGLFYLAYQIDPKDQANLYNAAAFAVNAKDYDTALTHYLELDRLGFTGEGTNYTAVNKQNNQREYFPNKQLRDVSVQNGLYINPKDEKLPSLKGDIVKNIALIYNQKGDIEKAKQAMSNARKANPDDSGLIIAEADLYLKTNDIEMYKKLTAEAAQKNPTNADLFYNLGVVTTETDKEEAKKHYEKALQINPNHVNANINMGTLMLANEEKIVKEMNSLGTSAKDNKRYDELKKQRDELFKKAMPYYEKALKTEPDNEYAITMMANIYQALDMPAEAKAMKAKLKK
ncbi:tetratricopeptide repeat protein [Flavobacterium cyanobacteriorum]|nr:hypothetical protein [Flavobacterium cyanobacteriorum]